MEGWFVMPQGQHLAGLRLFASRLLSVMSCCHFFPVGIVSQLSTGSIMTATENNMRSFHEEGWERGQNPNLAECIPLSSRTTKQPGEIFSASGDGDLEFSSGRNGRAAPPEYWGEYGDLSTWGMLLCCCLVIKAAIIRHRTQSVPRQHEEMNHPEMHAFYSFDMLLAFWHLLNQNVIQYIMGQ